MTIWILICTTITLGVAQMLTAHRVRDLQERAFDANSRLLELEARVLDLENPI